MFSLIISQYFINTLTNSSSEQLSEEDKEQTETKLFECYKKLFHEGDNGKSESFKDIPLKELLNLQDKYLKEKFKIYNDMNSGGTEYEVFLKMACNLMLKSEGNKELTVADLEDKKDIFKDLKFIELKYNDGIKSKYKLFNKIRLKPNDFGAKREGSDFSIVHCTHLNHAFVIIIDKTKKWKDAINKDIESIYLIDSSGSIEYEKQEDILPKEKGKIFKSTPTLNDYDYQKNGTCWLNAMSAVGFLLERQQKRIAEQKKNNKNKLNKQSNMNNNLKNLMV